MLFTLHLRTCYSRISLAKCSLVVSFPLSISFNAVPVCHIFTQSKRIACIAAHVITLLFFVRSISSTKIDFVWHFSLLAATATMEFRIGFVCYAHTAQSLLPLSNQKSFYKWIWRGLCNDFHFSILLSIDSNVCLFKIQKRSHKWKKKSYFKHLA